MLLQGTAMDNFYDPSLINIDEQCYEKIINSPPSEYLDLNCTNISNFDVYDVGDIQVPLEKRLIPAIFGAIFFVGTIGNALVIYVIYRVGTMKTVTNIYLGNLAAADLLFLLICVTFTVFEYFMYWPFGVVPCKLVTYLMVVTMAVSVFTLTAISVDRYVAVVHPIRARNSRTMPLTTIALIAIWVFCGVSLCPIIMITEVVDYWDFGRFRKGCFERWPSNRDRRIYTLCIFAFLYVIPFAIMALCYWQIRKNLLSRVRPGNSSSRAAILKAARLNRNVVKLVLVVTLVFGVCWLPTHVVYITADYSSNDMSHLRALHVFKIIAHCMSYANSALNPVIYCFMSTNFRHYFKLAFTCAKHRTRANRPNRHHNAEPDDQDASPSKLQSMPMLSSYVGRPTHEHDIDMAVKQWPTDQLLVPRQATYDITHCL